MTQEPSSLLPPLPPPLVAPSGGALVVRLIEETNHPEAQRGPARRVAFLREPSRGLASLPLASRLVVDRDWLGYAQRSSLGDGPAPGRASGEARPIASRVPAPSPLPGGGALISAPGASSGRMTTWKTYLSTLGSVALFAKGSFEGRLTR